MGVTITPEKEQSKMLREEPARFPLMRLRLYGCMEASIGAAMDLSPLAAVILRLSALLWKSMDPLPRG